MGVLPDLAAAPMAVYALQRIVAGYTGPLLRVRRPDDNAEMDVSPAPDSAHPDWPSVQSWSSSGVYVTTWHDQSGNGRDAARNTAAAQPHISFVRARGGLQPMTHEGTDSLAIPASVAGDARGVTAISVQSRLSIGSSGGTNQAQWMLGAAWNTDGSLSALSVLPQGCRVLSSSTFLGGGLARSQPEIIAISSGNAGMTRYRDGQINSLPANNPGTFAGGLIGRGGSNYDWHGDTFFFAVYPAALDESDMGLLRDALNDIYRIIPLESRDHPLLVSPGNSIVLGTGASLLQNNLWFTESLLDRPVQIMNCGVFGQLARTIHDHRATYLGQFSAERPVNMIVAPEPTNDINSRASGTIAGFGSAVWTSAVKPFVEEAVAADFKVLLPTTIRRNWTGSATDISHKEAERLAYNDLARAHADGKTVFLVDYAADDPALNLPDGVHPDTPTYRDFMAVRQAAAVNAILQL